MDSGTNNQLIGRGLFSPAYYRFETMKKILRLILLCLLALGCNKEKNNNEEKFFPVSARVVYQENPETRTALEENHLTWSSTDAIGLYAGGYQTNVRMSYKGEDEFKGNFTHVQDERKEDVSFFAYYPYTASVEGTMVTMAVSSTQIAPFDSRNDFMVSSSSVYGTYDESDMMIPNLMLDRHLCSVARISIRCSNATYSSYQLKSITLSSAKSNLCGEVTFDVRDGACIFSGTEKSIVLSFPEDKRPILGSGTIELNALLIPCSVKDLTVTISTNHGEATVSSSTRVNFLSNRLVVLPTITSFTLEGDPDPEDDRIPCVFMGDSITQFWAEQRTFFSDNGFVGKGRSGHWTSDMLSRFKKDVVDLSPKAVIIHGGTNDIGHPYYYPDRYPEPIPQNIVDNIAAMANLAIAAGIKPILTTICPNGRNRKAGIHPKIVETNNLIKQYAEDHNLPLVDYYSLLVDNEGYLPSTYANDGLHPNAAGYAIMEAACLPVINQVIGK